MLFYIKKSKIIFSFFLFYAILFSSCSSGEKIWEFEIGQSRESVVKELKNLGYLVEDFSQDSYVTVRQQSIEYYGINWRYTTFWFDDNNKLDGIEFNTFRKPTKHQMDNLGKYLEQDGYKINEEKSVPDFYIFDKLPISSFVIINDYSLQLSFYKDAYKHS